jgi:nucleoid-associated protein YgaU
MSPDQKKNILDQAIDLITDRDEKAAAAAKAAAEAAAKAKAEADAKAKADADAKAKTEALANEAYQKAKADEAEKKRKEAEAALANEALKKAQAEALAKAAADAILTTHKVVAGETLSGIALKYYKSSTRDSWMKIYEANKAVIGDNPGMIKAGQELKIPKL